MCSATSKACRSRASARRMLCVIRSCSGSSKRTRGTTKMAAREKSRADARMEVQLASTAAAVPHRRVLTRWALSALAAEKRRGVVCLRIVDETESRTLNARYRDRDRSTNVLSFTAELAAVELDPVPLGHGV